MTSVLEPTELAAGWAEVETQTAYRHLRPLSEARDRFVREAQSNRRIELGIEAIDRETCGISPGHLGMVVGYSHNGKTQLMLNAAYHNRTKHIALMTPDEPAPLVIAKFASLVFDVPSRQLDRLVTIGDRQAMRMLDETLEEFPHLVIFDKPMSPKTMAQCYEEALDSWGVEGDLVVFDYLDLMSGGDLAAKAQAVKDFGIEHDVPLLTLHQTSRSAGTQGRPIRIDSGFMGGETWATYQFGVWRKRYAIQAELAELWRKQRLADWEQDRIRQLTADAAVHEHTITVNLSKNKRPGGGLVEDGVDFELHSTGLLTPFNVFELRRWSS